MSDPATIGQLVKNLRETRLLTQMQLASLAGVSPSTISRLESGTHMPELVSLVPILRAAGAEPEQLRAIGAADVADTLSAHQDQDEDSQAHRPETRTKALVEAFTMLVDAGWTVTAHKPDDSGRILIELI